MFGNKFLLAVSAFLAVSVDASPLMFPGSSGTPVARRTSAPSQSGFTPVSFNNWGGFSSMSNFDNFYGSDNFDGFFNEQIIIEQSEEVVCSSQEIEIVQQRLAIIQQVAQRIILEQICEVEVQTIVLEQFQSSFSSFSQDISHVSNRQIGFDQNIASMLGSIIDENGSLSSNNLGFSGSSVGSHTVTVGGNNWNDQSSPSSVSSAKKAAKSAASQDGKAAHQKSSSASASLAASSSTSVASVSTASASVTVTASSSSASATSLKA